MKRLLTFITIIAFISVVPTVLALDASQSATVSGTSSKAQDLLNRVAGKVADLASKLRRTYTGKIKSVGTSSYIVTTQDGDKTISTNEVTSFFKIRAGSRSDINFTGLKVGDYIAAIGTIDPQTGEMTAKQIIAKIHRYNLVGTINSIIKGVAEIKEVSGQTTKVDLNDAVKLLAIDSKGNIVTAKLADFNQGNIIFAMAYVSDPASDTLSALKALVLPK